MSVYRVEKTGNFTIMSNHHLQDRRLSLKAKGLLSYMLSLPDDWDYSVRGLAVCCKEGADAIRHAIHELEANGYLRRTTDRSSGKISGQIYDIFEEPIDVENAEASEEPALDSPVLEEPTLDVPMLDKPVLDFPILDFPTLENPTQDFPTQQSTKEQNTNIQNTYQSNARINPSYHDETAIDNCQCCVIRHTKCYGKQFAQRHAAFFQYIAACSLCQTRI